MKKVIKNKLSNILLILFIFLIIIGWFFSGWPQIWQRPQIPPKIQEAQAAVAYQSAGAIAYSASGGTSVSPAYPASIVAGDLLVLIIGMKPSVANGGSVTIPSGWTQIISITGAGGYGTTLAVDRGNTNLFTFYKVAVGTESGSLLVTLATNDVSWAQMYRLSNATGLWSIAGTIGSDTTAGNVSIAFGADPGVTAGDYILGAMCIPTDVTTPNQFSAEAISQSGITFGTVTEISEPDSNTGNDIGGFTYQATVNSGTSSGVPTLTATAGGTTTNVRGPGVFIRVRERPKTTIGDGTDPANSTVAPGSANQYLDQFTFLTSTGADSVTALTVITANTATVASMQIWNNAMTVQYFSTVSTPAGNSWNFSGGTPIPITTSQTAFRVIFTAKNHASLAQGTYPVTGTVTSFTCANTEIGTDTDSATITIDNSPPADATWGTITTGDSQIILNWTNPGDADFNKIVILRKNNSAITDAPTDGTEYNINNTIGLSTVRYVGNGTTFTDTGLTNGTNYYYKIFAYDAYINYAVGLGTGPHLPLANVVSVGTSGSQTSSMIIPSINNYVDGAFTFIRSAGTTNVTQIIITETGTVNAYTSLSNVKLYYDTSNCVYDGTEPQYGLTGSFNSSAKATFNGNVPIGTSQICFYVVLDVGLGALDSQTLEIEISNPSTEVTASAGNVSPATPVVIVGTTTLEAVIASWRENLDTPTTNVSKNDNIRLRIELANVGGSGPADFRLEYAPKNVTCGSFIAVPTISQFTNQHFVMSNSIYVINGQNTAAKFPNVESYTFDSGKIIAEPSNSSGSINLSQNHYTEIEFVFKPTNNAVSGTDYCFRITNNGVSLDSYAVSPELQITP